MAQYNNNIQSIVKGLSDFWLSYFKEIDQLEVFYRGSEILVGQSYLDLLGLLLNSSVQDAPLFNKEYFKLLRIKETDLKYRQGADTDSARYVYELPDNVVTCLYLNNKILAPTAALDRNVDFFVDTDARNLEFRFDVTNTYRERIFGSLNSEFRVRSRLRDGEDIEVWLQDDGTTPVTVTRTQYSITVQYDGPANTSTGTAAQIVSALNLATDTSGIVLAELTGNNTGNSSPAGTVGFVPLIRGETNPLDGFASRRVETAFDAKLTLPTVTNWMLENVQRGDIVRLISGTTIGTSQELPLCLVRKDGLYLETEDPILFTSGNRVEFAVLRSPVDDSITDESFQYSGFPLQNGIDGLITGATREFSSPTAVFKNTHVGDIIEYFGTLNTGHAVILDVVDQYTVVLGASLVNDAPVVWNLYTSIDPANTGLNGVLTETTFTSATAAFTPAAVGTVLRIYRGGEFENYDITAYVSPTQVTVSGGVPGTGLEWAWVRYKPSAGALAVAPPAGWAIPESVTVVARRYVDNEAVQVGRDYTVNIDTGVVTPKTVWRTSLTNTVSYRYRIGVYNTVTAIQSGTDATITPGSPNVFSSPTANFVSANVGYVLRVGNSGFSGATNNGDHVIAAVLSPTTVELTAAKTVPSTPDTNNGVLTWELLPRGFVSTSATTFQTEVSAWAPDALVDRFHLYNTYGYLINRFDNSSEQYRSLIRGIFQLFMLGPTLERFESAINVVAGLPVIRDNGEILIRYEDNASQSGTDGLLDFTTKTFTAASANFVPLNNADYLYIGSGLNDNKLFKVVQVIDANTVLLDVAPTTDGPVEWFLSTSTEHSVVTSRTTYTFPRQVRLRDSVTDPANAGLYIFRAFEVMSEAFEVTDYVETPTWWEFARIPEELLPTTEDERRQSSPALFENVIAPGDDGRVGDPGYVIGADSEGNVPPSVFVRGGTGDGTLTPDPNYPFSNVVYFSSPTGNFTSADLGNKVVLSSGEYPITEIVSPTSVKVDSFTDISGLVNVDWQLYTDVLPMRHKMAFVVLDTYLKHHLFSVNFDSALLGLLPSNILSDLQQLVFVAKPSYTYILVVPSALFQEVINVSEDTQLNVGLGLGGGLGSIISANSNPLLVLGSSWLVGSWFRYLENTSTFAAPLASLPDPLGAPPANYEHYVNKFVPDFANFTSGSLPIQASDIQFGDDTKSGTGLTITVSGTEVTATFPLGSLSDNEILSVLRITGSGLGNDGDYTLGRINSDTEAAFNASLVNEAGLNWEIFYPGTISGHAFLQADGSSIFHDNYGVYTFGPSHVGSYVTRPFVNYETNQAWRIHEILSAHQVELADENIVEPIAGHPYKVGAVDAGTDTLTVLPGEVTFSPSMCALDRLAADPSTWKSKRYYVTFTSGPNTGLRRLINEFISTESVKFDTGVLTDAAADFYISAVTAYPLQEEISDWVVVKEQIQLNYTEIVFDTPAQDINPAVSYTAYGVREPIDLGLAVFDDTNGDTLYSIGMPDPKQRRGHTRTGRTTDLREDPIQITRT